jgi:hypothetical protein
MLHFVAACMDVVKFFQNHHIVKAKLLQAQRAEKLRVLVQPALTRWGTIQAMFVSLLASERIIHAIVTAREFVVGTTAQKAERQKIKELITDDNFIRMINKALGILKPIDALIVKYQSDKVPVSEGFPDFYLLPERFVALRAAQVIADVELQYLTMLAANRFKFMYGTAHGLSYLLDPRHRREGLPPESRRQLEDALIITPADDQTAVDEKRQRELFSEFTDFVIETRKEKTASSFRFSMLVKKVKSPLQYCLTDGAQWPLNQKIAINLFSMTTSSAASERNFSTISFIHSKLRNSLSEPSVEKLVFMKTNMSIFMTWRCPTMIRTWKSAIKLMMSKCLKSKRPKKPCPKIGFLSKT